MFNLNNEKNAELDMLFYGAIASQLGKYGLNFITPESKSLMSMHLTKVLEKFNSKSNNKLFNDNIYPQSKGIALEAFALLNATSFEEAGSYISDYLSQLSATDQVQYVSGFSNNLYLKRAFNEEHFLIQLRKDNVQLYNDTVGLSIR